MKTRNTATRILTAALGLFGFVTLSSGICYGAPVTFQYSGTVDLAVGGPDFDAHSGSPISLSFTFDSNLIDSNPSLNGDYSSVSSIEVNLGTSTYTGVGAGGSNNPGTISIINNGTNPDQYILNATVTGPTIGGLDEVFLVLVLSDNSKSVFATDSLPLSPPNPLSFSSSQLRLDFSSAGSGEFGIVGTNSVEAELPTALLDVTYDTPVINTGPLSFGLSALPAAPHPTFSLREGTPLAGGSTGYGLSDVIAASVIFGDFTGESLTAFDMVVAANGTVNSLTYAFAAIDTSTAAGIIVMNFPFSVTGTDIESGQPLSYTYANSTPTVTLYGAPVTFQYSGIVDLTSGGPDFDAHDEVPISLSFTFDSDLIDSNSSLNGDYSSVSSIEVNLGTNTYTGVGAGGSNNPGTISIINNGTNPDQYLLNATVTGPAIGGLDEVFLVLVLSDNSKSVFATDSLPLIPPNPLNFSSSQLRLDFSSAGSGEFGTVGTNSVILGPALPTYLLDVTYDTPVINFGPLSLGLSALPVAPQPTFSLREGTPLGGGSTGYGLNDVIAASVIFGDFTGESLTAFDMVVAANGTVNALTYAFAAIDTPTAAGIIILNFPFSVTGTDIASGQPISYTYANSTPTITLAPEISVLDLSGNILTISVENIPNGQTFHLRQSPDLTNFLPLTPPINITDTTPQPVAITVDRTTHPKLFFTIGAGASPAAP
jgi:hypothetical protein